MNTNTQAQSRPHDPRQQARAVLDLMRVTRPHGTFLLLLPSLWALVLAAKGHPSPALMAIFIVGAFLMRSAGCIINDIADRRIDPLVERTRNRPLAAGTLSVTTATVVFSLLVAISFLLILQLNRLTLLLSAAGLGLAVLYPFTKRFVSIPQAFLGMAFGWGTFMAWAAVTNTVSATALFLFLATICWAIAYDTIYAIQDIDDDLRIGVRSSAILFGRHAWAYVTLFLGGTCLFLGLAGRETGLGTLFFSILGACALYFTYQGLQVRRGLSRSEAFDLFKAHVGVGLLILAAMWADSVRAGLL